MSKKFLKSLLTACTVAGPFERSRRVSLPVPILPEPPLRFPCDGPMLSEKKVFQELDHYIRNIIYNLNHTRDESTPCLPACLPACLPGETRHMCDSSPLHKFMRHQSGHIVVAACDLLSHRKRERAFSVYCRLGSRVIGCHILDIWRINCETINETLVDNKSLLLLLSMVWG